MEENRLSVLTA